MHTDQKNARLYKGHSFDPLQEEVLFQNWREVIDRQTSNEDLYYRFYSGARRVRESSFSRYVGRCRRLAARLETEYDVAPGERVLVAMNNTDHLLVVYGALLYLGAVIVPVNPAENKAFISFLVRDCAPCLLIRLPIFKMNGTDFGLSDLCFTEKEAAKLENGPETISAAAPQLTDPACIIYTSGTTGRAKGVVQDHGALLANSEATRRLHKMDREHVHMGLLPLFHVNAFSFSFLTTLYAGARLILNRNFYQPEFWNIAEKENVQVISLVPIIINALNQDRREIVPPESLKYVTCAAAPLSKEAWQTFTSRFQRRVITAYGLSETVNFSLTTPPDMTDHDYEAAMTAGKRPPAGAPVFGNEVSLMHPDGTLCEDESEEGEIVIRGYNVMQGYHAFPEGNAAAFDHGWFHSGDEAFRRRIGEHDFYYITGRLKEIIKRKGEVVSLLEVDEIVRRVPGLENAVAVGFENRATGEEIGLFVVPNEHTLDAPAILSALERLIAAYRRPKVVVFGELIPRTTTGKIQRLKLSPLFETYRESVFS